MILSAATLRQLRPLTPFAERTEFDGMTYGLGPAGYDVRVEFDATGMTDMFVLLPDQFILASTIERFTMPNWVLGIVHDKSSWARRGLSVFNTVIEPGWEGFLTLELVNHGREKLFIKRGTGIAQVIFHGLDIYGDLAETYTGKYQSQPRGPQGAK